MNEGADANNQQPDPPLTSGHLEPQYNRVRGWLLFFCISLTILSPLVELPVLAINCNKYINAARHFDRFSFPDLLLLTILPSLLELYIIAFSIFAGTGLWQKRPGADKTAKKFLVQCIWLTVFGSLLPLLGGLPAAVNVVLFAQAIKSIFLRLIYFAIWYSYLIKSQRVRDTYTITGKLSNRVSRKMVPAALRCAQDESSVRPRWITIMICICVVACLAGVGIFVLYKGNLVHKTLFSQQGGLILLLEVQTDKAVENAVNKSVEEIKGALRGRKIEFTNVAGTDAWDIYVILPSNEQLTELNETLKTDFPKLKVASIETVSDVARVLLTMEQKEINDLRKMAIDQDLKTIRNRIDQLGVSQPDIRPEADDHIVVQLPGIKNPQDAVSLIGKMTVLEFKLVAQNVTDQQMCENKLPSGVKLYPMKPSVRDPHEKKIALEESSVITGDCDYRGLHYQRHSRDRWTILRGGVCLREFRSAGRRDIRAPQIGECRAQACHSP
jgi:hypothetical protein